ncbi:MAG: cation transporter [Actinomycetota bacterium]|nr:cation transporter [Actinomycetota bacterium]
MSSPVGSDVAALLRRGLLLEYLTIAWSVISAIVASVAGVAAGSIALVGFGLDSVIEVFAGIVVAWQLRGVAAGKDRPALGLIGGAFLLLAAYVFVQALRSLLTQARPEDSFAGIGLTAGALVVMTLLGVAKRKTGAKLDNPVLLTEAKVTLIDAGLAATLLVGLVLNAALGWWWADPLAALGLGALAVKEGLEAVRGE